MSVRRIHLSPSQQSFIDERACRATIGSSHPDGYEDNRPQKRRKVDQNDPGWSAVLEYQIECPFRDNPSAGSSSAIYIISKWQVEASIAFDDPIMRISHPETGRSLFAFVCQDQVEVDPLEKVMWLQKLAKNDSLVTSSARFSTVVSFREVGGVLESSSVTFRLQIRFDQNVSQVTKVSLKDRLALFDEAFHRPSTAVNADHFYTNIGKLPKDYILPGTDESLQHPAISCRLFPFQKRAVAWMLQREGIDTYHKSAHVAAEGEMPPLWERVRDLDGRILYINRHQALATHDQGRISNLIKQQILYGGILAEVRIGMGQVNCVQEMGLGKTVEIIDLILMNPRPLDNHHEHVFVGEKLIRLSKATVIITPPTIRIHQMYPPNC